MDRDDLQVKLDRVLHDHGVQIRDADKWKVRDDVFDEVTLLALYKLIHKKLITAVGGSISTGKEANVFYGEKGSDALAIKIYMIRTANFKAMTEYIDGDPRFSNVRRTRKEIIFAWTKKEFSNLSRAKEAGIRVPAPYAFDRNILLMEFLGDAGHAYPQLRHAELDEPSAVYQAVVQDMKTLYSKAKLVHADLSEYNLLWDGERHYVIDMGQAVTLDHPRALQFLVRDIRNINRFFGAYGEIIEDKLLFESIVGESISRP